MVSNTQKTRQVHNLIILDESGSMHPVRDVTIDGFNEVIQTVKGCAERYSDQKHFISFITFNGIGIDLKLFNEPVDTLPQLDRRTYIPQASTPLYDAMGLGMSRLSELLTGQEDYNVLVTVLTDGEENASSNYTGQEIKRMVDRLKGSNWTFTYIGTDHDVEKFADFIGIDNVMRFGKDPAAMNAMFDKERKARFMYAQKMSMNEDVSVDFYKNDEPDNPLPPTPPSEPADGRLRAIGSEFYP